MSAPPPSDDNWALQSTSTLLTDILTNLHAICTNLEGGSHLTTTDPSTYTTTIHTTIQSLNTLLHQLDDDTRQHVHVNVPTDAITKLNAGLNPDTVIEQLLQTAKLKNDQLRLKLANTSLLKSNVVQINNAFETYSKTQGDGATHVSVKEESAMQT